MDIQRVHQTISFMLDEDRKLAIQQTLEQLAGMLGNLQSQPNLPQFQTQAVSLRDQLAEKMRQLEGQVTPALAARIAELGSQEYFSPALSEEIEYEMQRNAMAPAVIAAKVNDLKTKRKDLLGRLESLRSAMDYFHVAESDLQPGDADIVFLVPRSLFNGHLEELTKELSEINGIIRVFSEAVTGGPEPVEVRRISSSTPTFFFHIRAETIEVIGRTVTWLITTLKSILDLRKLRQDAEKVLGKEEDLKAMFDKKIEERIDDAVKKRTQEILEGYTNGDTGRRNELGIALDLAQKKLLVRIERGMSVEVRVVLPEVSSGQQTEIYTKLLDVSHNLEIPAIEGPPILKLPSSNN
jgi:hypothetical protein